MVQRLKAFGKYGLFWLMIFIFFTILFLIYHYPKSSELSFWDLFLVVYHGAKMDLSMTGYLLLIPGLVIMATSFFQNSFLYVFLKVYTTVLVVIITLLVVADLELYRNWGFRLDTTPLLYITRPKEVAGSSDPWVTILLILMWIFLTVVILFAYYYWIGKSFKNLPKSSWPTAIGFLLLTASLILPIRGSLGQSNMNVGFVYFHPTNVFANHAAINVIWNVGYAAKKLGKTNYPTDFFDNEKTKILFSELYKESGKTVNVLNTRRPNIIIMALESFTSKVIEPLGGRRGVTPAFNKLVREGILFTNMYSSGERTDKGILSILSGYPAQPKTSIIKYPKRTQNLPFLSQEFNSLDYHTEFIFGYDIDYSNFRSYLSNAKFDKVISEENFGPYQHLSKWGIHDHEVLNKVLEEANRATTPFFFTMMTLSSHEPFEVPMETMIEGDDEESLFFNSVYYADKSLGEFISAAKLTSWWENTLIIVVADHGSRHPGNDPNHSPGKFKIPMLWVGGALAVKDTLITAYGNQTDIASTLLNQVELNDSIFGFSKNMLDEEAKSFAFFDFNNGYTFLSDSLEIIYDLDGEQYLSREETMRDEDKEIAKAYMQKIFLDFNSR